MSNILRRMFDALLGRGDAAVTVPPMDGALQPDTRIDEAGLVAELRAPDNLVWLGGQLLCSSGGEVLVLGGADVAPRSKPVTAADVALTSVHAHTDYATYPQPHEAANVYTRFDARIACLAAFGSDTLVVGLDSGLLIVRGGPHDGRRIEGWGQGGKIHCPTAMLMLDAHTLLVTEGSTQHRPADWQQDLMEKNASGSVWRVDLRSGESICLARGLAWPNGLLAVDGGKRVRVSESWRHRIIELAADTPSTPQEVLGDLPGYPGRMTATPDGGAWLAVFAARSQLVELVLREHGFRRDMMREIAREHWICPSLSSKNSHLEPLQRGGLKQMGILKPWAPTRSYGLVVRLDSDGNPLASRHSRADGRRHGITAVLQVGDTVYLASQGGDAVLALPASTSPPSRLPT